MTEKTHGNHLGIAGSDGVSVMTHGNCGNVVEYDDAGARQESECESSMSAYQTRNQCVNETDDVTTGIEIEAEVMSGETADCESVVGRVLGTPATQSAIENKEETNGGECTRPAAQTCRHRTNLSPNMYYSYVKVIIFGSSVSPTSARCVRRVGGLCGKYRRLINI